jgi:hypothetical protein
MEDADVYYLQIPTICADCSIPNMHFFYADVNEVERGSGDS